MDLIKQKCKLFVHMEDQRLVKTLQTVMLGMVEGDRPRERPPRYPKTSRTGGDVQYRRCLLDWYHEAVAFYCAHSCVITLRLVSFFITHMTRMSHRAIEASDSSLSQSTTASYKTAKNIGAETGGACGTCPQ